MAPDLSHKKKSASKRSTHITIHVSVETKEHLDKVIAGERRTAKPGHRVSRSSYLEDVLAQHLAGL